MLRSVLVLTLSLVSLGCASFGGCPRGDGGKAIACRTSVAREQLSFGIPRAEALAIMGESELRPPWQNSFGAGPELVSNPYDSRRYESPFREEYEVYRYVVGIDGSSRCPFIRGRLNFAPLVFFEDQLVGWKWSYLEAVLERSIGEKERSWSFGWFCDGQSGGISPSRARWRRRLHRGLPSTASPPA